MSKPGIKLEPMREDELDDFVKLYTTAFARPEADMIMPMMYPMGLSDPQVLARLRASNIASSKGHGDTRLCARDEKTGELLGIVWWQLETQPFQTPEEMETALEQAIEKSRSFPEVLGMNAGLLEAYLKASFRSTYDMTRQKPFVELRLLAVHPEHQGRGIGSMMIRDGLKKADEQGLPVFVVSALMGKPVYEHFGFDEIEDFPLDCRDYGGHSQAQHWSMLRAARK